MSTRTQVNGRAGPDRPDPALRRLDLLLGRAVADVRRVAAHDPEARSDGDDEASPWAVGPDAEGNEADESVLDGRLAWLARRFDLTGFDLDIVTIALAPDLDLRYERAYAYLQDDPARRRPSVDLALTLLCESADDRRVRRRHFGPDGALSKHGLARIEAEPGRSSLARSIVLDEGVVRLLLDEPGTDPRLEPFGRLVAPERFATEEQDERIEALVRLVDRAWAERRPLRLFFEGPAGSGRRRAARRLARALGVSLLEIDLAGALVADPGFAWSPGLIVRGAAFQGALLYVDRADALASEEHAGHRRRLVEAWSGRVEAVIVAGRLPSSARGFDATTIPFDRPDFARRRDLWRVGLEAAGVEIEGEALETLAGRYRLDAGAIEAAIVSACDQVRWSALVGGDEDSAPRPNLADLQAAARGRSGHDLTELARKVEPRTRWDDLVLPDDALAQLREIVDRVALRRRVWDDWGFDRGRSQGRGIIALFTGPPGTGKTLAAEVLAAELGIDLYKIDLSRVVSKWIGETEKNLDRVFALAEGSNAALFFDEADAMFGKRTEVHHAQDRFANIETSYLLQKMEQYDGIALLATNLVGNLDEAFTRRLTFTVHFPFPETAERLRLWRGIWPDGAPLADDVDLPALATRFRLSGGHIKNVALAAAFLSAGEGGPVRRSHVLHAIRREYQKMGKFLSDAELAFEPVRGPS